VGGMLVSNEYISRCLYLWRKKDTSRRRENVEKARGIIVFSRFSNFIKGKTGTPGLKS